MLVVDEQTECISKTMTTNDRHVVFSVYFPVFIVLKYIVYFAVSTENRPYYISMHGRQNANAIDETEF